MKKSLSTLVTAGMLFSVFAVGASLLDLSGSDTAPGTGTTEAACAGHLIVTHPVKLQPGHNNKRITIVKADGDMTQCVGQTMLVEVDLYEDTEHAYAVKQITEPINTVTFTFDETTGDFYSVQPTASGGTLVFQPADPKLDPIKDKDFGLVTISIAKTWA